MISIIVALSENYGIGCKNKLLWHLPSDLKRFKKLTSGKTIIVGRKTFESLPGVLPNRKHTIISNVLKTNHPDCIIVGDLTEILIKYSQSTEEVFVIGGASIYNFAMPYCKKLYLTKIFADADADAFFQPDLSNFTLAYESDILSEDGVSYKFFDYIATQFIM